jgi:DNA-binding response OmpR family regulator
MDKSPTILIVEDDAFLNKLYRDKLARAGFEVSVASTGEEALSKVKREKPALVLLDIVLHRRNGFDVLSELKLDDEIKHIPVIILTNLGQESDIKRGLELGANDYLVKTDFSVTQLPEVVRKHLITDTKGDEKEKPAS